MTIVHRRYLVNYGGPQWIFGYWKKLLDNPPCKKPGDPKNKQYEYEFELVKGPKNILYLHLVGDDGDLNEVERQLAKYKLARIENNNELILILDATLTFSNSINSFIDFCKDNNYIITGKLIHRKKS
ncbi:MAG: hypothetical protein ACTSO9_15230 [Candidatus Helarchaeota archaeon]